MGWSGDEYDARFARLHADGVYLHGEADFVDRLLGGPPALVLDAGCGTGRVAVELDRRGYQVVGVDVSADMLATARRKAPALDWRQVDLAHGPLPGPVDVAVAAGNVMVFLALGTERAAVEQLAGSLAPGGRLVAGFQIGRQLPLDRYDQLCEAAGLSLEARYATWDGAEFAGGDYAVSVHRRMPG